MRGLLSVSRYAAGLKIDLLQSRPMGGNMPPGKTEATRLP